MENELRVRLNALNKARDDAFIAKKYPSIGSNRVPDDDPAYVEDTNVVRASIEYIVSQSMM